MNKRVYGVLGISSIRANWNADFSGYPKTLSDGQIFGSDKAFKYPMKKLWDNEGLPVLYIKSMQFKEGKKGEVTLIPRTLRERYELLFGADDLKDVKKVLTNLMAAVDVKNFGATFAEAGCNIAITGAVQIGQGINKYENAAVTEQPILSPFRDGSKGSEGEDAKSSTIGTKIMTDEAHYFYPFVVNPTAYKELVKLGVTEGYSEEDYRNFKHTAISAATSYDTNAKSGCENELAVFIETDPSAYLPNLSEYVSFAKDADTKKNIISLEFGDILAALGNKVKSVEIYYNTHTTKLNTAIENAKYFDIMTLQEV